MTDVDYWRCPDCEEEITGESVVDETFMERVQAHEAKHTTRKVVVELEPEVLDILRALHESAYHSVMASSDQYHTDTLLHVIDKLREGFEQPEPVEVGDLARLKEMEQQLRVESRVVYADTILAIIKQVEPTEGEGQHG